LLILLVIGRHDWIRTNDLFRVKNTEKCNPLNLKRTGGSESAQKHPFLAFSTLIEPKKGQKEEIWGRSIGDLSGFICVIYPSARVLRERNVLIVHRQSTPILNPTQRKATRSNPKYRSKLFFLKQI